MANKSLHDAKKNKNDEFYTQLSDIEKELKHYKEHFEDKVIFCNCDDPDESNFWKYFSLNFNHLKIKKLLSTHYDREHKSYMQEMYRDESGILKTNKRDLNQNGDFRSQECIELLKQSDIVVTNPPFSLFREYIAQLMEYDKSFIIVGSMNAITYKEIFPLLKNNKLWLGYGFQAGNAYFAIPKGMENEFSKNVYNPETKLVKFRNCCWFTNLDIAKRYEELILYKTYSKYEYPQYDNYDAINIDKTKDIPIDYNGVMGVPITFMDKYCPNQFEIVGFRKGNDGKDLVYNDNEGKIIQPYVRILIKRKDIV